MKKQKRFLGLSVFLVLILLLTAIPSIHADAAGKIKLNTTKTTVYVGKTKTLKVQGTSKKVTWTSSDKKVATVNNKGKVTAKKAGRATITAKVSGKKYKCTVTVKNPYLNTTKKTLAIGKSTTLKLNGAGIKSVKTSDKKIAAVSKKGKVTAKKAGKATITITDKNGNTYKCAITVEAKHKYKSKVTKEATCNTAGSKHKICTVCGTETTVETIPASGVHSYSWDTNGDTRTMKCACGDTGITEYKYGSVWGYFDDKEAEKLWNYINEERKSTWVGLLDPFGNPAGGTYVSALNKNDSLFTKAKNRAAEAAVNFDHGEEEHECLAWGYSSGLEAYEAWCYSSGHARAMINPDYTIGGVTFFWYDSDNSGTNLTPIAVLELGY